MYLVQTGRVLHQHNFADASAGTIGTAVTTGAAASTKGSYAQLIASTNFDAYLLEITSWNYNLAATDSKAMMDVAIGAATEEIIIPDLLVGYSNSSTPSRGRSYYFPLYIPAGTAISARAAGQRVTTAMQVGIRLWGGDGSPPFQVGRKVTTYGVSTVPAGTTIVPGVDPTEGAWTVITASTTEDHFALIPSFDPGDDTTKTANRYWIDVGEGAATEEMIMESIIFMVSTSEAVYGPWPSFPHFIDIPVGTRLTMRAMADAALDSGNYGGCIYAVS